MHRDSKKKKNAMNAIDVKQHLIICLTIEFELFSLYSCLFFSTKQVIQNSNSVGLVINLSLAYRLFLFELLQF